MKIVVACCVVWDRWGPNLIVFLIFLKKWQEVQTNFGIRLSFGSNEVGHEREWNLIGELMSIRLLQMAAPLASQTLTNDTFHSAHIFTRPTNDTSPKF